MENYFIDRNQIAFVTDGSGVETFHYLYGLNVDAVMAQDSPAGMVWALADRLGSIDTITDAQGNVVDKRNFDSFGRILSETNSSVSFRYGYTSRERDLESGLSYYRARYYDSNVGRFISVDPLGFGAGDTNLYRYVSNNSTNYTDPTGNLPIPLLVLGGIALAGAAISAFQNYSYQKAQLADGIHPNNYRDGNKADVNLGDVAVSAVGGGVVAPLAALGVAIAPLAAVPLIGLGLWSGVENHSTAQAEYDAGHTNTAWYHEKMAFVDILTAGLFHSTSRPPSTLSPALAGGAGALLDVATAVPSLLSSAGAGLIGSSVGSLFQHYFASSNQSGGNDSGGLNSSTGRDHGSISLDETAGVKKVNNSGQEVVGWQVAFDRTYDLINDVIKFRSQRDKKGNLKTSLNQNVAVFEFINNEGNVERKVFTSENFGDGASIHSEQFAAEFFKKNKIPSENILRGYSEFSPCTVNPNYCAKLFQGNNKLSKVNMYYSYDYSADVREISRQQKYDDLKKYGVTEKK